MITVLPPYLFLSEEYLASSHQIHPINLTNPQMQAKYHAVLTPLLQRILHHLGDAGHDDENQALLWQLQEMLGRNGLLVLLQEHIDNTKYTTLLSLAQQLLGRDDEEAKQLEEQQ